MLTHTLLYLVDRLDTAEAVIATLQTHQIERDDCHILSKDQDSVRHHHLHAASDMERSDMWRSTEHGALFGLGCALVFAVAMAIANPLAKADWTHFLFATVVVIAFGGWIGGMIGARHSNFRLAPFYGAIEDGKYLMLVDVRDASRVPVIKQLMYEQQPQAQLVGEDERRHDPFMSSKLSPIRLRHTH